MGFKIERGDASICCNLLRKKYLGEKSFFSCRKRNVSQFWKGLLEAQDSCIRGLEHVIGDGKKARFWKDIWLGKCPLKIFFSEIFEICNQQERTVFEVLKHGDINLTFRRTFGPREVIEWDSLVNMLENINLSGALDTVKWVLEKSGDFSTASLYNKLTFTGFTNKWFICIWKAKLPLKIKKFL